MLEQVRGVTKNTFGQGFDEVMKHLDLDGDGKVTTLDEIRTLIFGDMLSQPAAPNRPYTECADIPTLQTTVESHLEQYNLMSTKKMDLVLLPLYAGAPLTGRPSHQDAWWQCSAGRRRRIRSPELLAVGMFPG